MSDLMLHGVLNMPLPENPAELDVVTWLQFKDRARQASIRIEELDGANILNRTAIRLKKARIKELEASRSKLLDAASEYRAAIVAIGTGGAFSEKTARVIEARNALDALIDEMKD